MNKGQILKWNKKDVADLLGVEYYELKRHLPESLKKELGWSSGVQYFLDTQVFKIVKYYRGLLTDEEIKKMLYPKGIWLRDLLKIAPATELKTPFYNQKTTIMTPFSNQIESKILKFTGNKYRLNRPVRITIKKSVIDTLKSIYVPSAERGGILVLETVGVSELVCNQFILVENKSVQDSSYNPDKIAFNNAIQSIIDSGNLPLAVHTHPTELGFHGYDNKRAKFYLGSSKPDRLIARNSNYDSLYMPEAIFVKDERFKTGFGLSLYEGTIFPNSITAISDLQLALSVGTGYLMLKNKLTRKLLYLLTGVFLFEFVRRPKYLTLENGDLQIKVSY